MKEKDSLPAEEYLIADKPKHILPREHRTEERYRKYGFRFDVPENTYNQGELYNLSVRSGILTREERFKIDEYAGSNDCHARTHTLPENLARVPEYAGNHHEALGGTGGPRKLAGDEILMPARIRAPYKKNVRIS